MSSEQRGFVFSVVFIVIFAALLSSVPLGLMGPGETPESVIPINPNLLSDFAETENFTRTDFVYLAPALYQYSYSLGGREWLCFTTGALFSIAAKVLIGGILWLGQIESCKFISDAGTDRDTSLSFAEIEADAENGTVRYTVQFIDSGNAAGGFVVYWNTTLYSAAEDAWDADELVLLHGMGFESTAIMNIGTLLLSLLVLQLPGVPPLVNLLLAVPIWASIVYLIWFIVKEMIPFL